MYQAMTGALGNSQSPIDLRVENSIFDPTLKSTKFDFQYSTNGCSIVKNTGGNYQVPCQNCTLKADHLPGTYKLAQFHGHWNSNPWNGSEHLMMGVGKASEIHLVHWNTKYADFPSATKHADGVAVVGIFLDESPQDNPDLDPLIKLIPQIPNKGDQANMQNFDLNKLLPGKLDFWTYSGSLTTPPYTECVIWTVLKAPITISYNQLLVLRKLSTGNNRAVHPINGREIRASFELGGRLQHH